MLKRLAIFLFLPLLSTFTLAQNIAENTANAPRPVKLVPLPPAGPVYIRCGALFDGKSNQLEQNVVIAVEQDRIKQVGKLSPPAGAQVIDLSNLTCLPGMVESHTHVFLQGDRKPGQYDAQLLKQSVAYRAIEATTAAHAATGTGTAAPTANGPANPGATFRGVTATDITIGASNLDSSDLATICPR